MICVIVKKNPTNPYVHVNKLKSVIFIRGGFFMLWISTDIAPSCHASGLPVVLCWCQILNGNTAAGVKLRNCRYLFAICIFSTKFIGCTWNLMQSNIKCFLTNIWMIYFDWQVQRGIDFHFFISKVILQWINMKGKSIRNTFSYNDFRLISSISLNVYSWLVM